MLDKEVLRKRRLVKGYNLNFPALVGEGSRGEKELKMSTMENEQMVFLRVEDNERDGSEEFHYLPVIMFAAWQSERDQLKAYELMANAYVVKPMNFENLSGAVRSTNAFRQPAGIPEVNSDGVEN